MGGDNWKMMKISEILGMPQLNTEYLPPHVIIDLKAICKDTENIGGLIIYGSLVRGDASSKSDIDIMVVPAKNKDTERLRTQLTQIFRDLEKKHNLKVSFSPQISDGKEDPYFLWEAAKDGVVIYCKPEMLMKTADSLQPYALVSYTYAGANQKNKQKIYRYIFKDKNGLQINKNNKTEYVAPGVLRLTTDKAKQATETFDKMGIRYTLLKIWG